MLYNIFGDLMKRLTLFSLIIVLIDQIIKLIVTNSMNIYESIQVINNFLNITYVRNIGAAFSLLSGNIFLLSSVSIIALILIYIFLLKDKKLSKIQIYLYSLLIGGIIGNLIDRIFRRYVVDYIDLNIFGYNFPVFNFADICIVLGVLLLLVAVIKKEDVCDDSSR